MSLRDRWRRRESNPRLSFRINSLLILNQRLESCEIPCFVQTVAEAASIAELPHYALLRPVLLELSGCTQKQTLGDSRCPCGGAPEHREGAVGNLQRVEILRHLFVVAMKKVLPVAVMRTFKIEKVSNFEQSTFHGQVDNSESPLLWDGERTRERRCDIWKLLRYPESSTRKESAMT